MTVPDLAACCPSCATSPDPGLATHCTLDDSDLEPRLTAIREASSRALIRARRDGGSVRLLFDRDAAAEMTALLDAERACCEFVTSESRMTPEGFEVTLSARPGDRAAAEPLFAAFMAVEHEA